MSIKTFKKDFFSSLIVFLIAVPLCLGIALASNVPPELGLLAGIIGGIIIGLLGGCSLQVSGPAAGLVAVVVNIIQEHGLTGLATATAIGGIFQIVFGIFKVGPLFQKIPRTVVTGMLAGIGILILLSQFITLGDLSPNGSAFENLKSIFLMPQTMVYPAFFLGLGAIGIIFLIEKINKKYTKSIPAPLIAVLSATFFAIVMDFQIANLKLPENFFLSLKDYTLFSQPFVMSFSLLFQGLLIALIATTESLLSVNAVDQMAKSHSNYNKEVMAQGSGNFVSGLLGGLPLTGVIVRSSANVNAGGQTRLASIMHGVWILVFVSFFTGLLSYIPLTSLAAILVFTGLKLFNPIGIYKTFVHSFKDGMVVTTTMLSIVFIDLLSGVIIGLVLSCILQFTQIKARVAMLNSKNS